MYLGDIFYTKEGDEVELHSGCLRDPIKEQKGVSVILMGLRSVKCMNNGTKNEELEVSANHTSCHLINLSCSCTSIFSYRFAPGLT